MFPLVAWFCSLGTPVDSEGFHFGSASALEYLTPRVHVGNSPLPKSGGGTAFSHAQPAPQVPVACQLPQKFQ